LIGSFRPARSRCFRGAPRYICDAFFITLDERRGFRVAGARILVLITAAYAQAAGAGPFGGASDTLVQLVPIVAMIGIVYFVLWRPQQRRAKEQREMVQAARRGDVVVTTGGLIGKVTKSVDDNEVEFEIAPNVRTRLARSGIAEVRAKGEPVKDAAPPAKSSPAKKDAPNP
jgi:preprotein translocase subunit YajC